MFYNISEHNVAGTIGFTTFPKTILLEPFVLQHCPNIMLLEQVILQHFQNNAAKNIRATTFPNLMLFKQLFSQHVQKQYCSNHWFHNISKKTKMLLEQVVLQHV